MQFNGDSDSAIDVPRPEEERETQVSKKKDLQEQLKVCLPPIKCFSLLTVF